MRDDLALGISATLADIAALCRRKLDGDEALGEVAYVNLGVAPSETVTPEIAGLIERSGWWVALHAIDLNISDAVDSSKLDKLALAGDILNARWFEEDLGVWTWGRMSLGLHHLPPLLDEASVVRTAATIRQCAERLRRPFIVENPPIHCAIGPLDMWDFMGRVAAEADCGLVLDCGHMIGWNINSDSPVTLAPPEWEGWSRVREIHVSGFRQVRLRDRDLWIDDHSQPIRSEQIDWIQAALTRIAGPCALCVELDGAAWEVVEAGLRAVRQLTPADA